MELSNKTKIGGLIKTYPFLLEYLITKAPKFSKLKNPLMRNTIGKIATIEQAATMGNLDTSELLLDIAAQIFKHSGDNVTLINEKEAPSFGIVEREERISALKDIVLRLHKGASIDEVRKDFHTLLHNVSPAEIGQMEQQIVAEGVPESEIKKLCDLHVELFEKSLTDSAIPPLQSGHPLQSFKEENKLADQKGQELLLAVKECSPLEFFAAKKGLAQGVEDLSEIIRHYERKENQLFPIMEEHGLTAPPQVMWELHDDIRALFKKTRQLLTEDDARATLDAAQELTVAVCDMIHKEENILFPMTYETFDDVDWARVHKGEEEIGYAWITAGTDWQPVDIPEAGAATGILSLDRGELTTEVVNAILKSLPVDLSFVDSDNKVAYFSQTEERIFPRSAGIIGRDVSKCHPPKSVHIVEEILAAFKAGERDVAEFWLELGGKFIHIRYFPVRDIKGEYLGCLEVSQDVTGIRALTGEQRLLSWK